MLELLCRIGAADGTIRLWRPDGTLVKTLGTDGSGGKFYNLAWSPDGRWLVGGATDYKLWRADGTEVAHLPGGAPSWGLAWAPDRTRWALGNESGTLEIYSLSGQLITRLQNGIGNVDTLAWSPDGTLMAGGNGAPLWRADGIAAGQPSRALRTGVQPRLGAQRPYLCQSGRTMAEWVCGALRGALGALPGHTG